MGPELIEMTPPNNNPYGLPPAPNPSHPSPPPANPYAQPYGQQYGQQYGAPHAQPGYPQPPPQSGPGFNPYVPPSAGHQGQWAPASVPSEPLAERGTRLVAHLIDGALYGIAATLVSVPAAAIGLPRFIVGVGGLMLLALFVYQTILLSTTGQSLGKKWLKIRIVKLDGSPVDFVSAVLLRSWAFAVLAAVGSVMVIGTALPLVDALLIFGDDRRCLHDHLAGTKVVVA